MRGISKRGWWFLWLFYALLLFAGTQYPFQYHFNLEYLRLRMDHIESFPQVLFGNHSISRRNLADYPINVVLFFPFGFLGYQAMGGGSSPKRRNGATPILLLAFLGCLFSMSIEFLQLFSETRFATVSDVIGNTAGAAIGVAFALALR